MLRIFTKPDRNSQKLTAAVAIIQFPFSSALTGKPGKKKRMKVRRKKKKKLVNSQQHQQNRYYLKQCNGLQWARPLKFCSENEKFKI